MINTQLSVEFVKTFRITLLSATTSLMNFAWYTHVEQLASDFNNNNINQLLRRLLTATNATPPSYDIVTDTIKHLKNMIHKAIRAANLTNTLLQEKNLFVDTGLTNRLRHTPYCQKLLTLINKSDLQTKLHLTDAQCRLWVFTVS